MRATLNNTDILCLLETRVKLDKSPELLAFRFENWNVFCNYDHAENGRIWFLWRNGLDISLCHKSAQSITVKCIFKNVHFLVTGIYGHNDGIARRSLWQDLRNIESRFPDYPWIMGGEFNVTLYSNESSNHELLGTFSSSDMIEFQDLTNDIQLHDHPFFGPTYSWRNKQGDNFLARKLDRVLTNSQWFESFPQSFVEFLAHGPSNHCMALVTLNKEIQLNKPKPFKFFNCWTLHQNFLNTVSNSWLQPCHDNPMKKIFLKLKRHKASLKILNKNYFSDIYARVRSKRDEIKKHQILTFRGVEPIETELDLQRELNSLEETEAMILKQKAKNHWMKEGDKCSKFFYSVIATKNKRDTIRFLVDDQVRRLNSFDDMSNEAINFFKNFLGSSDPEVKVCSTSLLKGLLHPIPSFEDYEGLTKEFTNEEIKEAIFSQGNDKAPGPDGYTHLFFKKAWHVIGDEVIEAIKFFFQE
ncbi:uncharacterized protein LOC120216289 [Hibiscus syriacus]|uniref:uncharacterized protein LOC120216289 n=1 Tax=Hibiscus syriacus TaxID=106335 RepID=UPI0019219AC3|nr:uncharacterized protein LOC120216289 [Hibiscus syriacus]